MLRALEVERTGDRVRCSLRGRIAFLTKEIANSYSPAVTLKTSPATDDLEPPGRSTFLALRANTRNSEVHRSETPCFSRKRIFLLSR